jgi:hypothetical protein
MRLRSTSFTRHLIIPPIIKSGRARRVMRGLLLGELAPAAVAQVLGNPSRSKCVTTDSGLDPCRECTPANHSIEILVSDGLRVHRQLCRAYLDKYDLSDHGPGGTL